MLCSRRPKEKPAFPPAEEVNWRSGRYAVRLWIVKTQVREPKKAAPKRRPDHARKKTALAVWTRATLNHRGRREAVRVEAFQRCNYAVRGDACHRPNGPICECD